MLPDSRAVARAFERTEFSVVVDTHPTDTTRRASLVLPTTTLLEDDDLLGAYGHHWVGESRPVVAPPPGVLTDLQIMQELAKRLGLEAVMAGSAAEWKRRLLNGSGIALAELQHGAVRNPRAETVLFAGGRVPTATGRVQLLDSIPTQELAPEVLDPDYPLHMLSNSTTRAQSSQWAGAPDDPITAVLHPQAAKSLADGVTARLSSRLGSLIVRLRHDPRQRPDLVIVPKGGHFDRGHAANALIEARTSDHGLCAAYQDARVRIDPL
jgi:anaerobic selenocysteine-containing dehydrogenase